MRTFMEDLEKKAKLAKLIESASHHARCLALAAQSFNTCVTDIPSWYGVECSPAEKAATVYLEDIKILVDLIENNFCDIRNFIDEGY